MNIYWESQSGGLCRKHSLNAYFEGPKISENDFPELCKEYDKYIYDKYNVEIHTESNDCMFANDMGIISYLVKKYNHTYCFHFPINYIDYTVKIYNIDNFLSWINDTDFFFVYNHNHIWGIKKHQNQWYKVDSLSGVNPINVSGIVNEKNIGLIVPRKYSTYTSDLNRVLDSIRKYIIKNGTEPSSLNGIIKVVKSNIQKNELLGDMETLYAMSIDIIEASVSNHGLVSIYTKFLQYFERNKSDTEFIETWFPLMIDRLINRDNSKD
jgi:hypothetical protein